MNQSVVALVADPAKSSCYHLYFDLERRYEEFRRVSDAHSSRGSLTTKLLASLSTIRPSIEVLREFDAIVSPTVSRISGTYENHACWQQSGTRCYPSSSPATSL